MDGHVWLVLSQDPLGVGFALAEGDRSESGPHCGKSKATDSAEQVNVCSLLIHFFPDSESANKGLVPTSLPRRGTAPAFKLHIAKSPRVDFARRNAETPLHIGRVYRVATRAFPSRLHGLERNADCILHPLATVAESGLRVANIRRLYW